MKNCGSFLYVLCIDKLRIDKGQLGTTVYWVEMIEWRSFWMDIGSGYSTERAWQETASLGLLAYWREPVDSFFLGRYPFRSNCDTQEGWQSLGSTICNYFGHVLETIFNISVEFIKSPDMNNVHHTIRYNNRFFLYFQVKKKNLVIDVYVCNVIWYGKVIGFHACSTIGVVSVL